MTENEAILELGRVSVVYNPGRHNEFLAVDDASLDISRGEVVGLVGESGSGKTTLGMVVAGLLQPTKGNSLLRLASSPSSNGAVELTKADRAEVQMIFQDPHDSLDPRQRIGDGLRELRVIHRDRTAWITDLDLLARVGLEPYILERFPHQLSGGQAQRVCIARALLLRPSLLVADEATSALDVIVQAEIVDVLKGLQTRERLAILYISHDLGVVAELANRIYVMCEGKIVESGDTSVVLSKPKHNYTTSLINAIPGRGTLLKS